MGPNRHKKNDLMRQLILALLLAALCLPAFGQNRLPDVPERHVYTDYSFQDRGFWCAIESNAESSIILNHDNTQRAGITYSAGYQFSEFLKLGVGLGVNWFFHNNSAVRRSSQSVVMPLSLNIRGNFISHYSREFVPFWSLAAGNAFGDGAFLSPCIGFRFGSIRNAWLLGLNYTIARIKVNEKSASSNVSFLGIKAGYEF